MKSFQKFYRSREKKEKKPTERDGNDKTKQQDRLKTINIRTITLNNTFLNFTVKGTDCEI